MNRMVAIVDGSIFIVVAWKGLWNAASFFGRREREKEVE